MLFRNFMNAILFKLNKASIMSLSFLTPEVAQRMETVLTQLEQSSEVWKNFVTYPANTQVPTASGPIPSLRWMLDHQASLIANAVSGIRSIQQVDVDPDTRVMYIRYSDGTSNAVGVVDGEPGKDGVSVINVELFKDPLKPEDVFLSIELSNGVTLRTRDSLKGYNGSSISTVAVENNNFIMTLSDGTVLPPVPVAGLNPVSINGVEVKEGELFFKLTNGQQINAGLASQLKGRGISSIRKQYENIQIAFDDSPNNFITIGQIDGIRSLFMEGNLLKVIMDSNPQTPVTLAALTSLTGAEITEDHHLVLTTNAPSPSDRIDLGPVLNLRPKDGVGIKGITVVDSAFVIELTDDTTLPPISVEGLDPISIVGATIENGDVFFNLSNGRQLKAGLAEDLKGAGINAAQLDADGRLYLTFERDPNNRVYVGNVPGIEDVRIVNGRLLVRYNTHPEDFNGQDVGSVLGIDNVRIENGHLVVTYTDATISDLGLIKMLDRFEKSSEGNLLVYYNDGTSANLGSIKGDKGDTGVGISSAEVTNAGDLIIHWSDNRPSDNLGQIRSDVLNYIGKQKWFSPTPGTTEIIYPHGGELVIFKDSELLNPEDDYNASALDRITFNTPFVGTEKVLVISYQLVGSTPSGRGVRDIAQVSAGVYQVRLESGQTFSIDTNTPIQVSQLPPGIEDVQVLADGRIRITLTNGQELIRGNVSNRVSMVGATIDASGNLVIETNDPSNRYLTAGPVLNGLSISSVRINPITGNLILTLNSGQLFDAGPTATYVTRANVRPSDGMLQITLSNDITIDAGIVRNPLLGSYYDFICFEGQTEFPVNHGGYQVLVWARGVLLTGDAVDTSVANKVVLRTPRKDQDPVRILLMTAGETMAVGITGEQTAQPGDFYGKDPFTGEMGFWPVSLTKFGHPNEFVATSGQTTFVVNHGGQVEVFVNGRSLSRREYELPDNSKVVLATPLAANDDVKIISLIAPRAPGDFLIANYARVMHQTNTPGGTFSAGGWQLRSLNTIGDNSIGLQLSANRMILPAGKYYIRGWAAVNGVTTNALRLYNQTANRELLVGPAVYASRFFTEGFQGPNTLTPIEGYFSLTTQSALLLQNKCLKSQSTFGLGAVGLGVTRTGEATQASFGFPATLVDLQIWKIGN